MEEIKKEPKEKKEQVIEKQLEPYKVFNSKSDLEDYINHKIKNIRQSEEETKNNLEKLKNENSTYLNELLELRKYKTDMRNKEISLFLAEWKNNQYNVNLTPKDLENTAIDITNLQASVSNYAKANNIESNNKNIWVSVKEEKQNNNLGKIMFLGDTIAINKNK
ncbi:hypothetical protein [Mycoplasmopsis meleagridis]|uniref:hypothetical protein n=1 Tax=Mycoplasmopsis meleagridis TaxID=29561 RepID=UPI00073D3044|nr:hypothetical protein [Mycoplasmopsis meleagridis]KUH47513.1 hypothetical protein ASB56_00030 [Mycoplasmopsis meleagridis]